MVPLLRDSVGVLMQRQPRSLDQTLPGCYQRVSNVNKFWLLLSFFWEDTSFVNQNCPQNWSAPVKGVLLNMNTNKMMGQILALN